MIDLNTLTLKELEKLGKNVAKAIATSEARRRKDARAAIDKVAKEYGVSVEDVLKKDDPKPARKKPAVKAKKSAPKFRNPEDAKQTWSGKGRRPAWYLAAIEAGKTDKDLAI